MSERQDYLVEIPDGFETFGECEVAGIKYRREDARAFAAGRGLRASPGRRLVLLAAIHTAPESRRRAASGHIASLTATHGAPGQMHVAAI